MMLDRIDIDAHGPLTRVELGPFAEHLNVVCGPEGSGKTAIARFIRDSLVDRDYPLGMLSSSTGRVVWADRNGLLHCRREKDGTAAGRQTTQFESRGGVDRHFGSLASSWLAGSGTSTASSRGAQSLQLPESIVDGVITDTAVTSVARVVSACVRSGLDSHEAYRAIPLGDDSVLCSRDELGGAADRQGERPYDRDRRLREQLADVEAELAKVGKVDFDHQALVARRDWLSARLADPNLSSRHAAATTRNAPRDADRSLYDQCQQRLTALHDRASRLRARQAELRRWISELDSQITRQRARDASRPSSADYQHQAAISDENLRRQLDDLDAQMIRWRRTLLEVRGLHSALLSGQAQFDKHALPPLDESSLRRLRLDGFLHAIDRYDPSRRWDDFYPEAYRPLDRIDDISHRIDSASRQIDWLLQRYTDPDQPQSAWYQTLPESMNDYRATTLGDTLRAIREDLRQVQRWTFRTASEPSYRIPTDVEELRRSEQWLVEAVEQLVRHRESLLQSHATTGQSEVAHWSHETHHDHFVLRRERETSIAQLDRVTGQLDACLREAADVRRRLKSLPLTDQGWYEESCGHHWVDRDAMVAELRRIDDQLASSSRGQWLRARRRQLLDQLRVVQRPGDTPSPLADAASRWLVRLSAGRLRRIDWPMDVFRESSDSYHRATYHRTEVTIDGRDETQCLAVDRALAVMAVRMAAGDLLARTGRRVPLVFETHREMFGDIDNDGAWRAYSDHGHHFRSNHPIAAALRDYSHHGRQVVLLTSNRNLTAQLARVGARTFQIHAERVVHAHRPLWRPQYEAERYVGPHPHTYGRVDVEDVARYDHTPTDSRWSHRNARAVDINRDFDMAWREASGFYDNPQHQPHGAKDPEQTDWARDGVDFRDGYYFADAYTTVATPHTQPPQPKQAAPVTRRNPTPASPFYLSVDSPIDQAPSIDAVAAARLRGLGVTHITHLMQQDSNRLADALGLASVDAATIRQWKSECRLVCRVPHLRGFDARVLVGCGVTTPAQLASIHPVDLLQEVESFLATERGQQILLSGSSHELSRITSWIAAANCSPDQMIDPLGDARSGAARDPRPSHRSYYRGFHSDQDSDDGLDSDRYEYAERPYGQSTGGRSRRRRRRRTAATVNQQAAESNGRTRRRRGAGYRAIRDTDGSQSNGARRSSGRRSRRDARSSRSRTYRSGRYGYDPPQTGARQRRSNGRGYAQEGGSDRTSRRRDHSIDQSETPSRDVVQYDREAPPANVRADQETEAYRDYQSEEAGEIREIESEQELRFYLHRSSPVVDAPSIGSRMAERLNAVGIDTVDDLLASDPDSVASELDHRRVDADTVLAWQHQATLVCCVPMLRGHDAQLLVAAEVTTPEELAAADAQELLGIIDPIARSSEGKRIIRGGKLPDLEEITDWIHYAQHWRELRAA